jgi:hypothetical protein
MVARRVVVIMNDGAIVREGICIIFVSFMRWHDNSDIGAIWKLQEHGVVVVVVVEQHGVLERLCI